MYDHIIVGAGTAGCVLAARLSEDLGVRVLLLEAGPPDDAVAIHLPGALTSLVKGPYDWDHGTVPQEHASGRNFPWPRGRVLGGSSSTNMMIYTRGHPHDYDTWRDSYGCGGWGHDDLLPYFLKAEDQQRGASEHHGAGGPLRVEDLRYKHRLTRAWVQSAVAYGLKANSDFNGAEQDGAGFYQVMQKGGKRWSTASAYLRPALERPNLTLVTDALVTRVLIENGRATGVQYERRGTRTQARAEGEVILSAGAVGTPRLLMLSGIGPADHLREHGIDVLVDAPVGQGLQDHPYVNVTFATPRVKGIWESAGVRELLLWRALGRGPYASNLAEAGGFVRTVDGLPASDLQYLVLPTPFVRQGLSEPSERVLSVLVTAVAVAGRGSVTLRSADPNAKPLIDPAYLADKADLDILVAGIRQARQIAATGELATMTGGERPPESDEDLADHARRECSTLVHPASTCAMGGSDATVCDPALRVRGVANLRVADASVMPTVPRGDPTAPTIALAERASDLVRNLN